MKCQLLIAEIGSTTTVVTAFDSLESSPCLLGQGMAPTTVLTGDVNQGLHAAVADLKIRQGWDDLTWNEFYACSSAAGGLKMTVHGLVYDMTARAAREAALGAGAVVKLVTAGELSEADLEDIMGLKPNIVLLAGGVDHGDRRTAVFNARQLASLPLDAPIVYAGNVAARTEVLGILTKADKRVIPVDNVYPRIDELNIEPTRRVIQSVFEDHIVMAPGMDRIRELITGRLMPTPGAVMNAALALEQVLGDVMIIDVGGATTDVHSVTEGAEEIAKLLVNPEPVAKRTVEGDLGVYVNARNLIDRMGSERLLRQLGFEAEDLVETPPVIPRGDREQAFVMCLTQLAVELAVARHAGRIKHLYGPTGRVTVAVGKDLSRVKTIVGTGGPLTALPEGDSLLEALLSPGKDRELYPKTARIYIDRQYIAAACGVMASTYPWAAQKLLMASMAWEEDL